MRQVSGNSNRPQELGTTGIIVFPKCDKGQLTTYITNANKCDCIQVLKDAQGKKNALKRKKADTSLKTKPMSPIKSSVSGLRPNIRNSLRERLSIVMCIIILIM